MCSGGNTVNELDQGDIHFEPGDKKWMNDMSLHFLLSIRMGCKEVSSIMCKKDPATSLNEILNAVPPLFN